MHDYINDMTALHPYALFLHIVHMCRWFFYMHEVHIKKQHTNKKHLKMTFKAKAENKIETSQSFSGLTQIRPGI